MTIEEAEGKYNEYLDGHITNVCEALDLLNTLDIQYVKDNYDKLKTICQEHDASKYSEEEYIPYREHFYPINDEEKLRTEAFEQACRHHIKNNKHHWDYWLNENNELDIPDEDEYKLYCVERCCDWLAMACQHEEVSNKWYNENKESIIMPDYGWELCDEIMSKVPEKCDFSFKGTRGELDEEYIPGYGLSKAELQKRIKEIKPYYNVDKSQGELFHIYNYLVKSNKTGDNKSKQVDIDVSSDEYKSAMEELNSKKTKHVHYDASYETDESNEEKDKIRKELGESFKVIRGEKGYLLEASMKYLKRKTLSEDPTRAKKSKNVQSKYIGISKYGVLNFETTSETYSGVKWYQEVHFPSFTGFMNIVEQGDEIEAEDVKKAMSSDNIKISCDDPSFLYWAWKYMAWKDVYGLEKETRAPKRNNTRLQGGLCKHLYSVIELLGEKRIIDLVTRDLNQFCKMKLGITDHEGYQDAEGMMNKDFKANQYDYNIESILKDLLSKENYAKYMDGTPLEDLGLSDKEMADIDKAIKGMRSSSQYALRSELEKQFAPAKRGRRITRDDIKLQVGNKEEEGK